MSQKINAPQTQIMQNDLMLQTDQNICISTHIKRTHVFINGIYTYVCIQIKRVHYGLFHINALKT